MDGKMKEMPSKVVLPKGEVAEMVPVSKTESKATEEKKPEGGSALLERSIDERRNEQLEWKRKVFLFWRECGGAVEEVGDGTANERNPLQAMPEDILEEVITWSSPKEAVKEVSQFFADAEQELLAMACRLLPHMTNSANASCLSVARLGRSPPRRRAASPLSGSTQGESGSASLWESSIFGDDVGEEKRGSAARGRSEAAAEEDEEEEGQQFYRRLEEEHLDMYTRLQGTIAAACALGHRACQVLWGPVGCGKSRLLRCIVADTRQQPHTIVFYLDGGALRSEMAALRVMADQWLTFLLSPSSAVVRAADASIRTGTFDFGRLFRFPQRLRAERAKRAESGRAEKEALHRNASVENGVAREAEEDDDEAERVAKKQRKEVADEESPSTDDEEEEEEEEDVLEMGEGGSPWWGNRSGCVRDRSANALAYLDTGLHQLRAHGVNILVCIRQAEQFCVWCDQLLYVLAGLLHDAGENTTSSGTGSSTSISLRLTPLGSRKKKKKTKVGGKRGALGAPIADGTLSSFSSHAGGMVFLFTSNGPDLKDLEKRLSSRLTPEARHVPLLPWTPRRLIRATLRLIKELHACRALVGKTILLNAMEGSEAVRRESVHRHKARPKTPNHANHTTNGKEKSENDKNKEETSPENEEKEEDEFHLPKVLSHVQSRLHRLQPFFSSSVLYGRRTPWVRRATAGALPSRGAHAHHSCGGFVSPLPLAPKKTPVTTPSVSPDHPGRVPPSPHGTTLPAGVERPVDPSSPPSPTTCDGCDCAVLHRHPPLLSEWIVGLCDAALHELDRGGGEAEEQGPPSSRMDASDSEAGPHDAGRVEETVPTLASLLSHSPPRDEDEGGSPLAHRTQDDEEEARLKEALVSDTSPDIAITIASSLLRQVYTGAVSLLLPPSRERLLQSLSSSFFLTFPSAGVPLATDRVVAHMTRPPPFLLVRCVLQPARAPSSVCEDFGAPCGGGDSRRATGGRRGRHEGDEEEERRMERSTGPFFLPLSFWTTDTEGGPMSSFFGARSAAPEMEGMYSFMAGTPPPPARSLSSPSVLWAMGNPIPPLRTRVGSEVVRGAATAARLQRWHRVVEERLFFLPPSPWSWRSPVCMVGTTPCADEDRPQTFSSPCSSLDSQCEGGHVPNVASLVAIQDPPTLFGAYDILLDGGKWIGCGYASREAFLLLCTLTLLDPTATPLFSVHGGSRRPPHGGSTAHARGPPRLSTASAGWRTVEDVLQDVTRLSSISRRGGGASKPLASSASSAALGSGSSGPSTAIAGSSLSGMNAQMALYRTAVEQLHRWGVLGMTAGGEQVRLLGDTSRWKDMVGLVLTTRTSWCEQILGLDSQEILRFRSLLDR